jgi:hypothetical protein
VKSFPKLRWYEWLWSALPLLLALPGGLLGGGIGMIAFGMNVRQFVTEAHPRLRWMVTALITVSATIVYLIVATLVDILLLA